MLWVRNNDNPFLIMLEVINISLAQKGTQQKQYHTMNHRLTCILLRCIHGVCGGL